MVISKNYKQVLVLYSSTLLGLFLGVVTSVINTHALDPQSFGDYQYVQNIITFISSLLLLGYFVSGSRLLAISKSELFSRKLRGVLVLILLATNLVLMICLFFFYLYSSIYNDSSLSTLYLCGIPLCGNVLMHNFINTVSQGDNQINRIAISRLAPSILYILLAYPLYQYKSSPELMLVLYNGSAILVLSLVIISTKPLFKDAFTTLKVLHEENKSYGFNVYIGSVLGVSTQYIAAIALGMFCEDNTNVGFYTLALTMATPLALLPGIIGTTYFKRFANEHCISKKVLKASIFIASISCLFFCLFIDFVVELLYNDSYGSVSVYAKWLSFGMCLHGIGDMLNRFLGAHGQGKQLRNAAFACGIVVLLGCFILIQYFQILGAIITKIASSSVYMFVLLYYYRKFVNNTIKQN